MQDRLDFQLLNMVHIQMVLNENYELLNHVNYYHKLVFAKTHEPLISEYDLEMHQHSVQIVAELVFLKVLQNLFLVEVYFVVLKEYLGS